MPEASDVQALHAPSRRDIGLIAIGVVAVSTSAPIIAATAAPTMAIAFWRNALGAMAIAPVALVRNRGELRRLKRREWLVTLFAGAMLALHFGTWIPSLDFTSVASSTALVATQPVWAALIARGQGHVIPRTAWLGIAIALLGVLVLTGVDVSLSARALWGDLLALAGGVFAAAYVSAGAVARRTLSTTAYTLICYAFCAVLLLAVCVLGRQQLTGYNADTWAKIVALTVGAQLLGHSVFNVVLKTTSPTVLSLAILFEMPGAAIIAAVWLGQTPPWGVIPAAALLLAGVAIVVRSQGEDAPPAAPAE
ncbi:MAG: DMT family transporter [Candidatus Nanopelagicales bacterium]